MVGSVQNANLRSGIEMYYGPYEEEEPYLYVLFVVEHTGTTLNMNALT